ncbi:MAG: DNA-binding protein WhiA [Firmicutes bacterium]|nr:DNA-binding protein WhiA [Bacillota bacterium]
MASGTFSDRVKNEAARIKLEKDCCRLAELSGLLRAAGSLQLSSGQQTAFHLSTDHPAVARRIIQLSRSLFDWPAETTVQRSNRLGGKNRYLVRLVMQRWDEDAIRKLGIIKGRSMAVGIRASLKRRQCCRRAFLRGVFLGAGSISRPDKAYHLEIIANQEPFAQELVEMMATLGLNARIHIRKQKPIIYLKGVEQIAELLSMIGAHNSLLYLQELRIMKEMRGNVNRLVNCDTANLEKTVSTGLRQAESIRLIAERLGMERIDPKLRQVAEARLSHPEATLGELAEILGTGISRSGINHRLRRLEQIARGLAPDL